MQTLGPTSTKTPAKVGRLETSDGKHAVFMNHPGDRKAVHAQLRINGHWLDDGREQHKRRRRDEIDEDPVDDTDDSDWDEVADVICAGRGRLGVAVAIAAKRAGLDVLLADGPGDAAAPDAERLDALLGIADRETADYLRALTVDFTPLPAVDPTVSVRVVDGPLPPELARGRRLSTFYGAALRDWGAACVSSPYGLVYTRVADPVLSATYTGVNGSVEATVLETIDIDPERPVASLEHWLAELEHDDNGVPPTSGAFQRLVFDDGVVVGAVLETAAGVRTVRARHGVMLSLGDGIAAAGQGGDLDLRETAQVALVSRPASRFARLELLTRERG